MLRKGIRGDGEREKKVTESRGGNNGRIMMFQSTDEVTSIRPLGLNLSI